MFESVQKRGDLDDLANGFYAIEDHRGEFVFRWATPRFSLAGPEGYRFVTLHLATPVPDRVLHVGTTGEMISLCEGWQFVDLAVPVGASFECSIDPPFRPGNGDDRALGIMLRDVLWHNDPRRHERISGRHRNAWLNEREYRAGVVSIDSVPPLLRTTMSKTCNIANEKPCVYCAWDSAKQMEQGAPDQTPQYIEESGEFFSLPSAITDCSFGEFPLERHFDEAVERCTEFGRMLEFTSNGQTLSKKVRAKLLGRDVRVHVSLDAATPHAYRRYRDHRFNLIVDNLRALCGEKKRSGNLPEVFVSFIVMRSNAGEVTAFLDLMADIGVDRVTFRSLYRERALDGLKTQHYGRHFDYDGERLSEAELAQIGEVCVTHGKAAGIQIALEWEEFSRNASGEAEALPLCSEPWKAAYILNRGIMPCCYGREPIADWASITAAPTLADGIRAALNSPPMQELRHDLASGRLGHYCEQSLSCPIVRASREAASASS